MRLLWFCSLFLLAGCDWAFDAMKPKPFESDLSEAVDVIAYECGTPPKWLTPVGTNTLALKADAQAPEKEIECIVNKIRTYPFKIELVFVGREAILENTH